MFRRNRVIVNDKTLQQLADAKAQGMYNGNYFQYPNDLSGEFCFLIQSKEYKHKHYKKQSGLTNAHFMLPIPQQLTDQQGINYNTVEMGAIGGAIAQTGMDVGGRLLASGNPRAAGEFVAKTITSLASQAMEAGKNLGPAEALAGLNAAIGGEGRGGALSAFMGEAPNPNVTAFFKGVPLKEHSFTWDLYPQSDDESFKLQLLINEIRKQSLPKREGKKIKTGPGGGGGGLAPDAGAGETTIYPFLTYPKEMHCSISTNGKQSTINFKPAFITQINANYAPGGPAFLENGTPAGIQLTLGFKEIDIWTTEDYDDEEFFGNSPASERFQALSKKFGLDVRGL